MEKKWSQEKNFVVKGHEQVETFANAIEACIDNPRKKRDVDVVRLRGRKDIQKFIKRRFINSKMKEVKGINKCEKQRLVDEYVEEHKLYESRPSIGINLKELSKYCRENGVDTTTLNMDKIKNRITKTISTEEALKDVSPMEWDEGVVEGKKKVVLTSPNVAEEEVRAIYEEEKEKMCEVVKHLKTEGKMAMLFELVSNGELEIAVAAKRASLSEEEFKKIMNEKKK